jgi:hypothetical protein
VIIHNCVRCKKCGTMIESFHRHDFKWCPCVDENGEHNGIAVDGGKDYLRRVGNLDNYEEMSVTTDDDEKEEEVVSVTKVARTYVCYQSVDSDRVEAVQALLDGLEAFPHLRVGQLISNARACCPVANTYDDEFYISDERFGLMIRYYIKKRKEETS